MNAMVNTTPANRSNHDRSRSSWLTHPLLWLTAWCALGGYFFWNPTTAQKAAAQPAATATVQERPKYLTKAIRDLEPIVDRVLADNPEEDPDVLTLDSGLGTDAAAELIAQLRAAGFPGVIVQLSGDELLIDDSPPLVDVEWTDFGPFVAADWRLIRLRMPKPDGGTLKITLARPLWWIEEEGVQLAETIQLDLPEMGAQGAAEVIAIEPCPQASPGQGRLVTGKFVHDRAEVLDLYVDGLDQPIGTTAAHPFWSEDRQAFIPAAELAIGEHLRAYDGTLTTVTRLVRRAESEAVFNLEVDGEHVYYVSAGAVLVHNAYSSTSGNNAAAVAGKAAHKAYSTLVDSLGFRANKAIRGTRLRPDAWKVLYDSTGKPLMVMLRELKPDNIRAIRRGWKALATYERAIKRAFPSLRGVPFLNGVDVY